MKFTPEGPSADVRLAPLLPVPALLREAGIDPAPLLAACGLHDADWDDPDARVPFRAAGQLLHDAAHLSGREDFGLVAGRQAGAGALGLLSLLMQRSASVGDALDGAARHLSLHDRGAVVYLRRDPPGVATLGYAVHDDATPGLAIIYDLSMAVAHAVLRALCGPQWQALEVRLPHARPRQPQRWRRQFAAPVAFDTTAAEIWFDARWLAHRPPLADLEARTAALREAQRGVARHAPSWAERARHAALALAMAGALSADAVARQLALHPRTLRRRLADEHVRLQTLINAARRHFACQLLRETRVPLAEVAEAVGYRDLTAFVRAFRGWEDCTPGRWRARAQAAARRRASTGREAASPSSPTSRFPQSAVD